MTLATLKLGKGQDAHAQTASLAGSKSFPLTVAITNQGRAPLVLAQAVPTLVVPAGATEPHKCQTYGQLYDVVFGMIAVADRLGQDIIGSVSTKLPKGASKP